MIKAILIAGGESSRFWPLSNKKHKSQIKILGRSLIERTIEELKSKNIRDIIIVHNSESTIKEELGDGAGLGVKIAYVTQETPNGTGDAVSRARRLIDDYFFVLHPHKIGIAGIIDLMLQKFQETKAEAVLVGAKTDNPSDFGMLKLDGGEPIEICENPISGAPSNIKSSGIYFFSPRFFDYYDKAARREEDLIDAINLILKEGKGRLVLSEREPASLKYPWDIFKISKEIFDSGNFQNCVSPSAKIGKNVSIHPPVFIGDESEVSDNAVIMGPVFIGKRCKIGFNNVLREYTDLEDDVMTGAFAEIKNSTIGEGTHIHSGFFGDSITGRDCRFGAGFITANRRLDRGPIGVFVKEKKINSGLTFFGAAIGENAKIGINVGVMPGIMIGSNCVIGPHSIVSENIKDGMTYYSKFEGVIKKEA